jgi:hypothetical protein
VLAGNQIARRQALRSGSAFGPGADDDTFLGGISAPAFPLSPFDDDLVLSFDSAGVEARAFPNLRVLNGDVVPLNLALSAARWAVRLIAANLDVYLLCISTAWRAVRVLAANLDANVLCISTAWRAVRVLAANLDVNVLCISTMAVPVGAADSDLLSFGGASAAWAALAMLVPDKNLVPLNLAWTGRRRPVVADHQRPSRASAAIVILQEIWLAANINFEIVVLANGATRSG